MTAKLTNRISKLEGKSSDQRTAFFWHRRDLTFGERERAVQLFSRQHSMPASDVLPIPWTGDGEPPELEFGDENAIRELFEHVAKYGRRLGEKTP